MLLVKNKLFNFSSDQGIVLISVLRADKLYTKQSALYMHSLWQFSPSVQGQLKFLLQTLERQRILLCEPTATSI